jgi:16S rRNA (uracil1498-N3)-methyltransferase
MHLFYIPQLSGSTAILSEEESKHCINVLRMKVGNELILVDGLGGYYTARITNDHPKKCEFEISDTKKEFQKRNFYLHLACAPTKNSERFEWFLEKATEIGIDAITPLNCEHSERTTVKPERLEKVIVSAMKQSIKAYKPLLNESTSFKNFIAANQLFSGQKFIAHCHDTAKENLQKVYVQGKDVLILIGPEGDFSKAELDLAVAAGFQPINLSSSRLRTETAALMACAMVNMLNES